MSDNVSKIDHQSLERPLPEKTGKRLLLTVIGILAVLLTGMEIKARQDNYPIHYPFSSDMWVGQWHRLDDLPEDQTVFVGASRVRHGFVVNEWEKQTEIRPLNLAWPGSPAGPVLTALAAREDFKGTVICGLTSYVAFANDGPPWMSWIGQNIRQSKVQRWSLAFHMSHAAQHFIRPRFKFINDAAYSPISNMFDGFPIADRPGMQAPLIFRFISTIDADLQDRYLDSFEQDAGLQEAMCQVGLSLLSRMLYFGKCDMEQRIAEYKTAVDRIEGRGGKVVFVHLPSDGRLKKLVDEHFPRKQYFDRLVNVTGCLGIHYLDHPELRDIKPVEESHLSKADGILFTQKLIDILRREGVIE